MITVRGRSQIPDDLLALMQHEDAGLRLRSGQRRAGHSANTGSQTQAGSQTPAGPRALSSARTSFLPVVQVDDAARVACVGCFFAPDCAGSCSVVPARKA